MLQRNKGKYVVGEVAKLAKKRGWFFGHFAEEELLKSDLVEVSWQTAANKYGPGDKHFHQNSVGINIVISGRIKITINGRRHQIEKGGFWVVWPEAVVENGETGGDTQLICIRAPSLKGDKFVLG